MGQRDRKPRVMIEEHRFGFEPEITVGLRHFTILWSERMPALERIAS
jgi:hypothetical protein